MAIIALNAKQGEAPSELLVYTIPQVDGCQAAVFPNIRVYMYICTICRYVRMHLGWNWVGIGLRREETRGQGARGLWS